MRLLKTRRQKIDHVEFSASGGLLAQGYEECLFWPNPLASESAEIITRESVYQARLCSNGDILLSTFSRGVFLTRPGVDEAYPLVKRQVGLCWIGTSPHEPLFVVQNYQGLQGFAVVEGEGVKQLWSQPCTTGPSAFHFDPRNSQFLTGVYDGEVGGEGSWRFEFRNGRTGEMTREVPAERGFFTRSSLRADGIQLASAYDFRFWVIDLSQDDYFPAVEFRNSGHKHSPTSPSTRPGGIWRPRRTTPR